MNITISIDCSPAEARDFFGLPDVKEMQGEVMAKVQEQMSSGLGKMETGDLLKLWMPNSLKGMDQLQEFFSKFTPKSSDND
ncbi:DUF6489 family protein [Actibacterium sp.]|uniref:DUF6489 family protein n=1 Tax=Actibacterium sp. TaxID=1872125 RepID=UPI003567B076